MIVAILNRWEVPYYTRSCWRHNNAHMIIDYFIWESAPSKQVHGIIYDTHKFIFRLIPFLLNT